jgi:tetratricopeptide (TPR) repeat protein/predicted Ser/Thr protein kinase
MTAGCPSETALLDLVAGGLAREESDALHAHLDDCETCQLLVAELARETPADTFKAAGEVRDLRRGESVDRYVVLEELGSGGMGVVYAAFDPQLDRKVALKLLRADPTGKDAKDRRARLLGEAQALARLSHPNVVTVYEAQALGERVWLAMELVEGLTLQRWLREAQRPRAEVLEVFAKAGQGLQAAHEAGLVHRDFKPENVLIGDDGRVRVTDFGLARRELDPGDVARTLRPDELPAHQSAVAGTPAYMAPEQWEGRPADARSDQFSFCVALWEALAGVRPFQAKRLQDLPEEIERGRLLPEAHAERIPGRLRRALLRGLRREPVDRFPSMRALLTELQRDAFAPFRRPLLVTAALVLLALGVLLGAQKREEACTGAEAKLAGIWDDARKEQVRSSLGLPAGSDAWHGVERALDGYAQSWARLHREACLATRVRREQSEQMLDLRVACLERRARDLSALTSLFVRRGALVAPEAAQAAYSLPPLRECAETDALAAQVKLPADAASRARIANLEGELSELRALVSAGNYAAARERGQQVLALARTVPHAPTRAEALYQLGLLRMRSGEAQQAEQGLLEAAWEAEAGRHDRLVARARIDLVYVVGELVGRKADAAGPVLREARAALERFGSDADLESSLETVHAGVLTSQDKCEEALPHLRQALALADRAYEADDPRRALILNNLGNTIRCTGDLDGALARHLEALALRERVLGPGHPDVAVSLNNIGNVYFSKSDYAAALPWHRRALAAREKALGADSSLVATGLHNVGSDLMMLGRNAEGRDYALRALALFETALGKDSPRLITTLSVLGHVEVDLGVPEEARRHLERALQLIGDREDDQTALARFNLARALRGERGDEARARELALTARKYYERRKGARKTELDSIDEWLKGPRSM